MAYPGATIVHLGAINFDHAPILLDTNPRSNFAHRPFRFEVTWLRDDRYHEVIKSAWKDQVACSEFIRLYKKQGLARDALRKWNKEVFGNCQNKINSLLQAIKEIQQGPPSENSGAVEDALQTELSEWLLRSETLWRQKSRQLWLKLGDRNTKFFHLSTIIRHKRNNIDAIRDEQGAWITEMGAIRNLFLNSFKNFFKQEEVNFPTHLEHLVLPCITEDENDELSRIPTPEEIKATLFNMQDLKAPGPDGYPVIFYKQLWPTVGDDVIRAVTSFFHIGSMPREVNNSLIVLIPYT